MIQQTTVLRPQHSPTSRWLMGLGIAALSLAALSLVASSSAASAADWELRFSTNNDLFVNNSVNDDFYTFGGGIEFSTGRVTVRWQENAFTDQADGFRFDESYLTIGGLAPRAWLGDWSLWFEAGAAHVGEGVLGQSVQNDVHELIGDDPVVLDYLPFDDYHAHGEVQIDRQWRLSPKASLGPQLAASYTHDFRRHSLAGLRGIWRPSEKFGVDATLGFRFADTELEHLAPHLKDEALAARVELDLPWGFAVTWTSNRYGTDRQHVTFVYRIGKGSSPRRTGASSESAPR